MSLDRTDEGYPSWYYTTACPECYPLALTPPAAGAQWCEHRGWHDVETDHEYAQRLIREHRGSVVGEEDDE